MPLSDAILRSGLPAALLNTSASPKEVFVALRKDGATGTGSEQDPFNGVGYVGDNPANARRFDAVMGSLVGSGITVRLGPGTFLTRGRLRGGWDPQPSQRVLGSGVFATTLKLEIDSSGVMTHG